MKEQLDCESNTGKVRLAVPKDVGGNVDEDRLIQQRMYGNMEHEYINYEYDRNDHIQTKEPDRINCCLYSDKLMKFDTVANKWVSTNNIREAERCVLEPADRKEFVLLNNCYQCKTGNYQIDTTNTPPTVTYSDPTGEYNGATFGQRLTQVDDNFRLHGHKCNYPASIEVTKPALMTQSWKPVTNAQNVPDPTLADFADGMIDVCFKFTDPSWPAVHTQSNEFVAQTTRIQYEILCDPNDQIEAYQEEDPANPACEVEDSSATNSYKNDPQQKSFRCPRLGGRANPCLQKDKMWELYSCDGTDCKSLEDVMEVMDSQYDPTVKGVTYKFEHDSNPTMNRFECSAKDFDNEALFEEKKLGNGSPSDKVMHFGPSTGAQYKHICGNGGQSEGCLTNRGEIIHELNTCSSADLMWKENTALKKKVSEEGGFWGDLNAEYDATSAPMGMLPSGETYASCSAKCEAQKVNGKFCGTNTVCEQWAKQRDLQEYHFTCGRTLKLRPRRDVNQQLMLRIKVMVYNTAVYSDDDDVGYMFMSQSLIPVSIQAKVSLRAPARLWSARLYHLRACIICVVCCTYD